MTSVIPEASTVTPNVQDQRSEPVRCPAGIPWCTNGDHSDPREHRHEGPEHTLTGNSYLQDNDRAAPGVAAFHLAALDNDQPRLVFQGTGLWPDLGLPEVDDLSRDLLRHAINLRVERRRLADALRPARTPITETEDERQSHAAFEAASEAALLALEKSPNRARTIRALRALVDMLAHEAGE